MLRTNPYKKKKREASKTLLIFGEGLGEKMFLKYLKSIYSYNVNVAITIKKGRGGCAQGIIIDAIRTPGAFDRKIVMLDNDKSEEEMAKARQEARNRSIELIENTPCLESLFITILDKMPNSKTSAWCKREFESNYIDKKKRGDLSEYARLFKKELLDTKRLEIPEVNKLISIMEGK